MSQLTPPPVRFGKPTPNRLSMSLKPVCESALNAVDLAPVKIVRLQPASRMTKHVRMFSFLLHRYTEQQFYPISQRTLHDMLLVLRGQGRLALSLVLQSVVGKEDASTTLGSNIPSWRLDSRIAARFLQDRAALLRAAQRDFSAAMCWPECASAASAQGTPQPQYASWVSAQTASPLTPVRRSVARSRGGNADGEHESRCGVEKPWCVGLDTVADVRTDLAVVLTLQLQIQHENSLLARGGRGGLEQTASTFGLTSSGSHLRRLHAELNSLLAWGSGGSQVPDAASLASSTTAAAAAAASHGPPSDLSLFKATGLSRSATLLLPKIRQLCVDTHGSLRF